MSTRVGTTGATISLATEAKKAGSTMDTTMGASRVATNDARVAHAQVDLGVPSYRHAYHEMTEKHVVEFDVLVQLKSNLAQLEDLHGRLKFMMGEISYLLKRS